MTVTSSDPKPLQLASTLAGSTWMFTAPQGDQGVTVEFASTFGPDCGVATVTIEGTAYPGFWVQTDDGRFSFQLPQNSSPPGFSNVWYGRHSDGLAEGVFISANFIDAFAMSRNAGT